MQKDFLTFGLPATAAPPTGGNEIYHYMMSKAKARLINYAIIQKPPLFSIRECVVLYSST